MKRRGRRREAGGDAVDKADGGADGRADGESVGVHLGKLGTKHGSIIAFSHQINDQINC